MKVWKYSEMVNKLEGDLDLQDETFITPNELIGYFNEAITEAEAEIHDTREDYFLSEYLVPCAVGVSTYNMPDNIFANKIRGFVYTNNTIIYDIKQYRSWHKFNSIELTNSFGPNDDYRYYVTNNGPGNIQLVIAPTSRDTAVLPALNAGNPSVWFTPMKLWYLRGAQRIPIVGEFMPDWDPYILPAAINTGTNVITLAQTAYVTGDMVQLVPYAAPGGTAGLPAPLVAGTTYYVITTGTPGQIKLATTLANATAGTAITLTSTGSATGYFNVSVAGTTAYINNLLVDIPEFSTFLMQWVRCRVYEKEGDPRLLGATATLEEQRKQMVDTLTEMIVDNDTEIQADFTHYQETT